jgi:hypothetical protein
MAYGVAAYLDDLRGRGRDGERRSSRAAAAAAAAARTVGGRAISDAVLAATVWEGDPTASIVWAIAQHMTGAARWKANSYSFLI